MFNVSMLKRYHGDGDYIIKWDLILLDKDLAYEEEPMAIPNRVVQKLRMKEIHLVKVKWKHHLVKEATWKSRRTYRTSTLTCLRIHVLSFPYFSLFFLFDHLGMNDGQITICCNDPFLVTCNSLI